MMGTAVPVLCAKCGRPVTPGGVGTFIIVAGSAYHIGCAAWQRSEAPRMPAAMGCAEMRDEARDGARGEAKLAEQNDRGGGPRPTAFLTDLLDAKDREIAELRSEREALKERLRTDLG